MTHLYQFLIALPFNLALRGTVHCFLLLLLLLCLFAILYYGYCIYAAIDFFSQLTPTAFDFHPPITILKPICGLDSNTYSNLASFCCQDYPEYQIIFGVRSPHDPSVAVVKQIIHDFPDLDIQLIVEESTIGMNFKVSNLANAAARAKYSLLLMADSDIRVGQDYLRRVVQPLADPTVGVVTCLYTSLTVGWLAGFEALGISTEFQAGVLVAKKLEGVKFALGATIVLRKSVLNELGGFLAIADYLVDDYQLGNEAAMAGYKVVLSDYVVEHVLATSNMQELIHRQTRWNRGLRFSRPWGYLGLILTHGTVTSLLFCLTTGGSLWGWTVLLSTWCMKLVMAWFVGVKSLNDQVVKKFLWLVPIRELVSFALWCYSFTGSTISWRGERMKLTKGGRLVLITDDSPTSASRSKDAGLLTRALEIANQPKS